VPHFVNNKKGCTGLATVHDKVCQLPAQGWRFPPVFNDRIAELLALFVIKESALYFEGLLLF